MYCLVIEQRLLPNAAREVSYLITWPTWSWLTIGRSTIASTLILIVVSNIDSLRGSAVGHLSRESRLQDFNGRPVGS